MRKDQQNISDLDENMKICEPDENGLLWHNPAEKPFRLCGFYWHDQDQVFRRLPVSPKYPISENVEALCNHTAGGQIRFRSDSKRISLKVEILNIGRMDHMPDTGMSGFDLYIGKPGSERFYSVLRQSTHTGSYITEMMNVHDSVMRDFVLNFPLYNGVKSLKIGLEADAKTEEPVAFSVPRPVVIYGTSITQGGCASRPGMAFSNILSRKLNVEFLNQGYSGNGKCETEMAKILSEISDPALFIIDCDANCSDYKLFAKLLPRFIDTLRTKHPQMPILIISRISFGKEAHHCTIDVKPLFPSRALLKNAQIQIAEVERRRCAGDHNIHFLDGSTLLGRDYWECTVDGVHPTDLGFYRIAENLQSIVESLIGVQA